MREERGAKSAKLQNSFEIGRQAQKSASTRKVIVEAALQCLIKYGYAQTTTPRIAAEAGLSRGAMMHHFSNRLTVIQAAIEHLHNKRLRAFQRTISTLPKDRPPVHDALRAYWRQATHPLFTAFHELAVAARTDRELDKILRPAKEAFTQAWRELAVELFPEWQSEPEKFEIALDLVQITLEGLAISRLSAPVDEAAEERLFDYLEDSIRALMPAQPVGSARTGRKAANA